MKYVVCAAFGAWLGWCLGGVIESAGKRGASYLQRIEQLEQRVEKLERPLPTYPKGPEGSA